MPHSSPVPIGPSPRSPAVSPTGAQPRPHGVRPVRIWRGLACWGALGCTEFVIRDNPEPPPDDVEVTETFRQVDRPRVDLLFVVDHTSSMEPARTALTEAASSLVATLDADQLAWQLGVVSTDLDSEWSGVLQGDPWILTPATDQAPVALARALDVTPGRAPTGGLGAATRALTEPRRSTDNRGFRRPDAALHVVVLSDADDESTSVLGSDPGDAFSELLADEVEATGSPAVLSAVVGDPGTGCTGPAGTALPGDTYARVARDSGGSVASICEADLGEVVRQLGTLIQEGTRRFELQAVPVVSSVRVEIDGIRLDEGWALELEPPAVRLEVPPPLGSDLAVRYTIARSTTE